MIPNVQFGRGFKGAVRYLMQGHQDDLNPDRVAWTATRNLPTNDPYRAARCMIAEFEYARTEKGSRCRDPLLHFSISWPENEHLPQDAMEHIIDRILEDPRIGLSEHQALIVAHNDTDHPHAHVLLNRIHPETGKTPKKGLYKRIFREVCTDLENEFGLRVVTHNRADDLDHAPSREDRLQAQRSNKNKPTPHYSKAMTDDLKIVLKSALETATSWDELDAAARDLGFQWEKKGQGLVLTDIAGTGHAKLSSLHKKVRQAQPAKSKPNDRDNNRFLEHRFGETFDAYQKRAAEQPQKAKERETPQNHTPLPKNKKTHQRSPAAQETRLPEQPKKRQTDTLPNHPLPQQQTPEQPSPAKEPRQTRHPAPSPTPDDQDAFDQIPIEQMDAERVQSFRERIGYGLSMAGGWRELEALGLQVGLRLAKGIAMCDRTSHFRLTQIDPQLDRRRLEQRYGESWNAYKKGQRRTGDQAHDPSQQSSRRDKKRRRDRGRSM